MDLPLTESEWLAEIQRRAKIVRPIRQPGDLDRKDLMGLTGLGEGAVDKFAQDQVVAGLLIVPPEAIDGKLLDPECKHLVHVWRRPGA